MDSDLYRCPLRSSTSSDGTLNLEMGKMKAFDLVVGAILARLLRWMALAHLHPNMNRITRNIWMGGANNPDLIISKEFDTVLDLRKKDNLKYRSKLENCGIRYLNINIPDKHGASSEVLLRIVEWLVERVRREEKVLVHCSLGRGRAALAIAAYLVFKGMVPEEAIKRVKGRRRVTFVNARQIEALQEFSNSISSHGNHSSFRNKITFRKCCKKR